MNESHDPLDDLLGGLQPRRAPPPAVQARAYANVHASWVAQRRRVWQRYGAMAAAAAVMAFAVNVWMFQPAASDLCFQAARGADLWAGDRHVAGGETSFCVSPGTRVQAERTSRIVDAAGVEFRLRAGSDVEWQSADRLHLHGGALHTATRGQASLVINTSFGTVADIGTVFTTSVDSDRLTVALREGSVQIDTPRGRHVAAVHDGAGERVTIDQERIVAEPFRAIDATLDWIFDAHPGYVDTDAQVVLGAIARDLGLVLTYASPEVQARVAGTELVGSLSGLGPRQALAVVAGVCDLSVAETSSGIAIDNRSGRL